MPEGERLIAFEAAIQELGTVQEVAARYRALRPAAEGLLGELMDLGRELRQATRRGVFTDEVAEAGAERVRRLRADWQRRLAELRASEPYRRALAAYAAADQSGLAEAVPALFAGVERTEAAPPLFRPLALRARERAGGSPFRPPDAVAADVDALRREGLRARAAGREWWDTDLPALEFAADLAAVEGAAALAIDRLAGGTAVFREGETLLVFAPRLAVELHVVLAESSDDAWYEAAEGSFEAYRDAVVAALAGRGVAVRIAPAWS